MITWLATFARQRHWQLEAPNEVEKKFVVRAPQAGLAGLAD